MDIIVLVKSDEKLMVTDYKKEKLDTEVIHKKIQLWISKPEGEYAIRLPIDSNDDDTIDFLALTNPDVKYERVVAEMGSIDDLRYGWNHVLNEFIANYKRARLVKEDLLSDKEIQNDPSSEFPLTHRYPVRIISYYRCIYCNAEFDSEQAKKQHQLIQHI